jgi:tRNA pseudouridine32 synthase / 23S rRNA pseudouridine746 synthase
MKNYKSVVSKLFTKPVTLGEFLLKLTKLNELQLKETAEKGGVWIQRKGKGKILRIRELSETLSTSDIIQLFYDPHVLKLPTVESLECLFENDQYGIWLKPAGVVPQGSQASDHASVLRYVEKSKKKEVFLVHRLDRETSGIMIVAYESKAAALLSDLFQKNKIYKQYQAIVLGEMPKGHKETIRASLDDKEAITHIEVLSTKNNMSLLTIRIETGRLHQIRRHLDFIGHPVIGDPKYGRGNKNKDGLRLVAQSLSFTDPWSKEARVFRLDSELSI